MNAARWLLLALLLMAAVIWALKQWRRSSPRDGVVAERTRRALAEMSWPEVERVVGDYFRGRDFAVAETERAAPGEAPDLVLTRRDEYYLAQCRRWRTQTVGAEAVREFHRSMAARHAAGGFIVTSGSFSPEARELARERGIELIGGESFSTDRR